MHKNPEQGAYDFHQGSLIFTIAALRAWPGAGEFAVPLEAHLALGETLDTEARSLARQRAEIGARAAVGDLVLDRALRALHVDALQHFRQDRTAEGFRFLFTDDIGSLTAPAIERQTEIVATVHERLSAPNYEGNLQSHRPVLQAALDQARAVLADRKKQELAQDLLRQRLQGWKIEANSLREVAHAELVKLGTRTHEGARPFADRFFP